MGPPTYWTAGAFGSKLAGFTLLFALSLFVKELKFTGNLYTANKVVRWSWGGEGEGSWGTGNGNQMETENLPPSLLPFIWRNPLQKQSL